MATTLLALPASIAAVAEHRPSVILCNGPGTCVPVCAAARLLAFAGVHSARVVFVESLCRTRALSLSGKLMAAGLADRVLVQWPQLAGLPSGAELGATGRWGMEYTGIVA